MAGRIGTILAITGLLASAHAAAPAFLHSQAAPGPLQSPKNVPPPTQSGPPKPQKKVEVRQSIAGAWKLNKDESDDGRRQIEQASRSGRGNGPNNGNGPYGRQGCTFGFPCGGG